MKFKLREDDNTNAAMEIMVSNEEHQDEAYVGPFWYDVNKKELFGQVLTLAEDIPYYHSTQFDCDIRTGRALHKNIWTKEFHRGKDKRFQGDYTKIPRGRVFQFKDQGFKVYVGEWIDLYPEAKQDIMIEFQLPQDNTIFVKDEHWNIGHGWSDEF